MRSVAKNQPAHILLLPFRSWNTTYRCLEHLQMQPGEEMGSAVVPPRTPEPLYQIRANIRAPDALSILLPAVVGLFSEESKTKAGHTMAFFR